MIPETRKITFRIAEQGDAPALLRLVRALAHYEQIPADIVFTEADIEHRLLTPESDAKALLAEVDGAPAGCVIYFYMATFFAVRWMVMEAIFVDQALRNHGIGHAMMRHLAAQALAEGCVRMEWSVMGWNRTAIEFYERIGATPCSNWHMYRIDSIAIKKLAETL